MKTIALLAVLVTMALVLVIAAVAVAATPTEHDIDAVASQLRCVVCRNLSVADSPSEMARQMRDVIRERLAGGETPAEIKAYFVARYGEWVLLAPPTSGFGLLAWALPLAALVAGLGAAVLILRRWSRQATVTDEAELVDEDALAAVRKELARRTR